MSLALWGWRKIQLDETGQCREGFLEEEKFKQNFEVEVYELEEKRNSLWGGRMMRGMDSKKNGLIEKSEFISTRETSKSF